MTLYTRKRLCIALFLACVYILIPAAAEEMQMPAITGYSQPTGEELVDIFDLFDSYAQKSMNEWLVPGMAVAVVRGGEVIYMHCFGNKSAGMDDPVTPRTVFQIGSTTKAFTAALVAMLVDDGLVGWDDRVVDHLPQFQLYDPWVTREFRVRDLLQHNSGLPEMAGEDLITLGYSKRDEMLAIAKFEPESSFRSRYSYNNVLMLWAAELVVSKTGKPWEVCLQERIFGPLSMNSSSSDLQSFIAADDAAALHRLKDNRVGNATLERLTDDWKYMDWIYEIGPAGGINSNIIDMSSWIRLQIGNGTRDGRTVLKEDSMRYMHAPHLVVNGDLKLYSGLGWLYEEYRPYSIVWHNGGSFGHHSMVALVPDAHLGVVILCNSAVGLPELLTYYLMDLYFKNPITDYSGESMQGALWMESLRDASRPRIKEAPGRSLPLQAYTGDYKSEIYGGMNISVQGDRLLAHIGPRNVESILTPWNRDTFTMSTPEFMNKSGFAAFQIGPDGIADSIEIDLFVEGEFGRRAKFLKG